MIREDYVRLIDEAVQGHGAGQDPHEFSQLLEYLDDKELRRVCEIGTFRGGTVWTMIRVATDDATIVSVDNQSWVPLSDLRRSEGRAGQRIEYVTGDSHDPATLARVEAIFGGEPIDFLLIDGDHTYEGVTSDWEMYSPLVRRGGVVAFHDVLPVVPGVHLFWNEMKSTGKYETREFFAPGANGFGVLDVPDEER